MLVIKGVPRVKSMARELLEEGFSVGAHAVKLIFDHERSQLVTTLMFFISIDFLKDGRRQEV